MKTRNEKLLLRTNLHGSEANRLVFRELSGPFMKTWFCVFKQPVASPSLLRGIQTALAPRPGSIILKTSVIGESV